MTATLGIDPGANTGLVVAQRVSGPVLHSYEVLSHETVKTSTDALLGERFVFYALAVRAVVDKYHPTRAIVEVPWRKARGSNRLSVYTRKVKGRSVNVPNLVMLAAITGAILAVLHRCEGLEVIEHPAPTGKSMKGFVAQKRREAELLAGFKGNEHECVACMLAVSGL